ncbi:MAG: hypothetical protein GY930_17940, partial [bacterium]|nr:hypothetical protein [bacterium]
MKEAPWGWLVGDLYLGNPRSIHVLIQDAAGDAIAGAIAFTVPHQTLQSEKSDELGRCLIEGVTESVQSIGALAVGYGEAHVPITGEGPTTITLDKTTLLEVEVLDARAQPDERLRLHLLSEQRLFFDNGI